MFNISDTVEHILRQRYYQEGEDFPKMIKRVSDFVASAETLYEDDGEDESELGTQSSYSKLFYDLMISGKFLPNSPCLMNAGTDNPMLFACYVLPIEDNLDSIMRTLTDTSTIFKYGGGVGYNFSKLRHKGASIGTGGTSSGSVSFMKIYDTLTDVVKQGGKRKGAMMGVLDITHPDIEEFINIKDDLTNLTNFNISIGITDEFMENVINDGQHRLIDTKGNITEVIRAKDLWGKIIKSAWRTGEPGVLFLDTINKTNTLTGLGDIKSTNPCFTGSMELLTSEGYKTFKELANTSFKNININGNTSIGNVWSSGIKNIVTLKLSTKQQIQCTPDHRFMTYEGEVVEAKNLKGRKLKPVLSTLVEHNIEFVKYGFIQGDGNLTRLGSNSHNGLEINIGRDDKAILKLFNITPSDLNKDGRKYYTDEYSASLKQLGFDAQVLPYRKFPSTYDSWNFNQKVSFLRGCYSANGSVLLKAKRVTYKTTCLEFANKLKDSLLELGIISYITTNESKDVIFSNGTYNCKESYNINIGNYQGRLRFFNLIGFEQEYKNSKLIQELNLSCPKVSSIVREVQPQEVFDFNEPLVNWGLVNGFTVKNCGELPLHPYGACVLGSINVSEFSNGESVDLDELRETVKLAVRFLDNCIDVNKYPLPEIEYMVKGSRKIGLGIMGLHDLLIKLNIPYNSENGRRISKQLMKFINDTALEYSKELAIEKSSFEFIDKSSYKEPIRNSVLTTIAPTGTLSTIVDVSSGCEPIFALAYYRNIVDTTFTFSNELFKNKLLEAGKTEEEINDILKKVIDNKGSCQGITEVPEDIRRVFVTAQDITPEEHILMQASLQESVGSSISKTVNLPSSATEKDVEDCYLLAWKTGCKGTTVYRDGCRQPAITTDINQTTNLCPECKAELDNSEKCKSCKKCGWSKCTL